MSDNNTNLVGIEQGRAKIAYECAEQGKIFGKEYKSYVKKLPMQIKTNGIGAAFGFILSKNGKKEETIYSKIGEQILSWLKKDNKKILDLTAVDKFEKLVRKVIELDSTEYRALTNEVLAFLVWLKRFSDGLIEEEVEG